MLTLKTNPEIKGLHDTESESFKALALLVESKKEFLKSYKILQGKQEIFFEIFPHEPKKQTKPKPKKVKAVKAETETKTETKNENE
jgi:hypothetical protein